MPAEEVKVSLDWNRTLRESNTVPTLLLAVRPMLRRSSPTHKAAFAALKQFGCDRLRYVPWYPYPRLGVAELEPSWDGKTP